MPDPVVTAIGLAKHYGGRPVVQGVSLELLPGQILGLVGANGGGKTTTLRMLAGLLRPDHGSGVRFGRPLHSTRAADRAAFGYMTQRLSLQPELSVLANLRFRCAAHGIVDATTRLADVTARYGIGSLLQRRVETLSGGQARRAQFVATVVHGPQLLLLDEPTAGLDVVTRLDIWRWLHALAGEGVAIVISTHDLADAEQCDRLLHYQDGRVEGPLTPAALIAASGASDLEAAILHRATQS